MNKNEASEGLWDNFKCPNIYQVQVPKEIKPVNPKGKQPWIFTGRTVAEAEAPTLWPPDAKSWLTGKDPEDGKDWRQNSLLLLDPTIPLLGVHPREMKT